MSSPSRWRRRVLAWSRVRRCRRSYVKDGHYTVQKYRVCHSVCDGVVDRTTIGGAVAVRVFSEMRRASWECRRTCTVQAPTKIPNRCRWGRRVRLEGSPHRMQTAKARAAALAGHRRHQYRRRRRKRLRRARPWFCLWAT